jgi:hypothetical protein
MDTITNYNNLKDITIINCNNINNNFFDKKLNVEENDGVSDNPKDENSKIKSTENSIIIKKKSPIINNDGIFIYYKRKNKKINMLSHK